MIDPFFFTTVLVLGDCAHLETDHGFGDGINYCQTQLLYIRYFIVATFF